MRTSRIFALLVALVFAGLPAGLASSAAAATSTVLEGAQRVDKAVYWDGKGPGGKHKPAPDKADYGAILSSNGAVQGGKTITLERRFVGGSWKAVDKEQTGADGIVLFSTKAVANASYRMVFAGDDVLAPSSTQPFRLKVMRDFNATIVKKRGKIWMAGNINPGWGKGKVVFERKTCESCGWKSFDRAKAGKNGSWKFRAGYPAKLGQEWFFRAQIGQSKKYVASTSVTLKTYRKLGRGTASAEAGAAAGR